MRRIGVTATHPKGIMNGPNPTASFDVRSIDTAASLDSRAFHLICVARIEWGYGGFKKRSLPNFSDMRTTLDLKDLV